MKPVSKRNVWLCVGIVAALMVLFAFVDLPISMAIFNIESPFGIFFAAFGESPMGLVGAFACAAMIATRNRQVKWKDIVDTVIFGLLGLLMASVLALMAPRYMPNLSFPVLLVIGLAYFALCLYICNRIAKSHPLELRRAAVISLFTLLAAPLVINIIKQFWGRPRMRIMTDPVSEFKPWYIPQGLAANDEYKSFPSGHSADAAIVFCITLLPTFLPKLKGKEWALYGFSIVWTGLVMLSRIIVGAHFASDVMMGASLSVGCFFLIKNWVANYFEKKYGLAYRANV